MCSYQTEECTGDGWYPIGDWTYKNENCLRCAIQEYRDYYCSIDGCTYRITSTKEVCEPVNEGMVCRTGDTECRNKCSGATEKYTCQLGQCRFYSWFNPFICNPYTCSVSSCTTICEKDCGADCEIDRDCCSRCEGDTLYYNGRCGTDCECYYDSMNCEEQSGWYDSGTSREWQPCSDNPCQQCKMKKQKYKDYYCYSSSCFSECKYRYGDYRWVPTGNRRDVICRSGYICVDGECIKEPCEGAVDLNLNPDKICPRSKTEARVTGLSNCNRNIVEFHLDSCTGDKLRETTISNGEAVYSIYFRYIGEYNVFACVDMNYDGDFNDPGESDSQILTVNCEGCITSYCICLLNGNC